MDGTLRETFPLPLAPLPDPGVTGEAGAAVAAVGSLVDGLAPILSEIVDELIESESLKR
jgi:hypothetical protein